MAHGGGSRLQVQDDVQWGRGKDESPLIHLPGERREDLPLHRREWEMGRTPGDRPTSPVGPPPLPLLNTHTPTLCTSGHEVPTHKVSLLQALGPQRAPQRPSEAFLLTLMSLRGCRAEWWPLAISQHTCISAPVSFPLLFSKILLIMSPTLAPFLRLKGKDVSICAPKSGYWLWSPQRDRALRTNGRCWS